MDHIHCRYMEPKHGPSQMAINASRPERARFPKNPAYESVTPRFLEPRSPPPRPKDELGPTREMIKHTEQTRKLYPELRARFDDNSIYQPREDSPRRIVEEKINLKKKQRALWRSDTIVGKFTTFDDLRKQTDAVSQPRSPRVTRATSPVALYIKNGTTKETTNAVSGVGGSPRHSSPNRGRSNSPSARAALGLGLRTAPPLDENGNPKRFPAWHAAGPTTTTFDRRWRETATARPSYAVMEKRIENAAKERLSARVEPSHVPRVAGLSIAELAKDEELHMTPPHQHSISSSSPHHHHHDPNHHHHHHHHSDEVLYSINDEYGGVRPIHWN